MNMKKSLAVLALSVLGIPAAQAAYPERPIRIIVPFPPGAGIDLVARMVATKLSGPLGQQIIVDNRPGAGGNIGAETVARSPADGYTLLLINNAQTVNAALNPKLSFDVDRDFAPLGMIGFSPLMLAASKELSATSVADIVRLAKASPGKLNYGSPGPGTPQHLSSELLNLLAGVKIVHVPYKGQGPATAALIANEIQVMFGTVAGFAPMIKANRVRPIATASAKRLKEYPDLPTIAESGYPAFDVSIWYALAAPAKTPPEIVKRFNDELRAMLVIPAERADFEQKGFEVTPSSPEELAAFIRNDLARWQDVVQKANLTLTTQ